MSARVLRLMVAALVLSWLCAPLGAWAEENEFDMTPKFDLFFQTYFLYQNDSDFDRTDPLYDEYGQSVGYIATVLEPGLTWQPISMVKMRYAARIGENLWSRYDPEQRDPNAVDTAVFQHREIWGELNFSENTALRTGFQHVIDPTRLFIDRYMGAGSLTYKIGKKHNTYMVAGQMPDMVYETTTADTAASELAMNNFENDSFVFGVGSKSMLSRSNNFWMVQPAIFMLYDNSEIDRPNTVVNPCVALDVYVQRLYFYLDLAGQFGTHKRAGLNNRDVDTLAGAMEFGFRHGFAHWGLGFDALVLTADDGDRYDNFNTGYMYSGKSRGMTMFLTENRLFDQYDNLDERAAAQQAGVALFDVYLSFRPLDYVNLYAVYGAGQVQDTTNLDDDPTLGHEADLGFTWNVFRHYVLLDLAGGGVWPGGSGARLMNVIDPEAREPIYHGQASLKMNFR